MRSGEIQADLSIVNSLVGGPACLPDLIATKADAEHSTVDPEIDVEKDVMALYAALDVAQATSALPEIGSAGPAVDDWLVRLRLATASLH